MSETKNAKRSLELTRRDVLRLGVGAAMVLPLGNLGCGVPEEPAVSEGTCDVVPQPLDNAQPLASNPADVALNEALFALGVTAGSVTASSAIVWSNVEDAQPKTLRVWRTDEQGARWLVRESLETPVDGYLKADVSGLASNTVYQYGFFSSTEARSHIGQFRTAYGDDCRRSLTIAATACTSLSNAPFKSLQALAKHDFDVFCHLGDMSYNDGAETTAEFRAKWRATLNDPGYRAVLPKAGMYITWDDHEFTDNSDLYKKPQEFVETGKAAFYESLPVREAAEGRLWRSYSWGQSGEFIILVGRTERKPETLGTDGETYLGAAQMEWFKERLRTSKAHFKVVLNSVPITWFPDNYWPMQGDRWQGFQKQRSELIDYITGNDIRNVWFLSGDFHVGTASRIDAEGPGSRYWEILVGPGANSNPLWFVHQSSSQDAEGIAPKAQFEYFSGEFAGTLLTFDPLTDSVRVRFIGTEEQVLFDKVLRQE